MPSPADLQGIDLQVYTATWCPDCRRLDRWLAEHGVAHTKVDLEQVPGAAAFLEAETGKQAIPFLRINGRRWVRGYHKELPTRFDPTILLAEILEAAR